VESYRQAGGVHRTGCSAVPSVSAARGANAWSRSQATFLLFSRGSALLDSLRASLLKSVPQGRFAPAFCAAQSVYGAARRRQLRACTSQPGPFVWVVVWRLVSKGKAMAFHQQRPNPSIEGTCNIRLRLLSPAPHVKR